MIEAGTPPEKILGLLGITEPEDLDIDAIAFACGATILRQPLTGCEANIVGSGNKAIITVNSKSIAGRQRFSSGHELGHWMKDRGQNAFGCSKSQMNSEWTGNNAETRANRFASDLLLPLSMFVPLAKGRPITLETVIYLAGVFRMSRTATAIRLVQHGSFPAMLVFYEQGRKKRFIPSGKDIPSSLFPRLRPDPHSLAATLLANKLGDDKSGDVRADRWFDRDGAEKYYIRESCFKTGSDSMTVLLWWEDEQQLIDIEEEEERRASRRSDYHEEH
ncbi:MAG TPA: ImmA/IrrE family metallo-endopeptidase [Terriglobales bacterium]|nr:ImmA/IrrE family metallo-endopeptidase [Terriglobales bacterium]